MSRCVSTSSSTRNPRPSRPSAELIDAFEEALTLYEQKEWVKAHAAFSRVLRISPDDGPAQIYEKRCVEYRAKPPAASWDGVYNLTFK